MALTGEATSRTRLRLGLLGPLSASIDGVDVGLGGRRQQAVVALLLLARGQQVGTGASSTRCGTAIRRRAEPPACSPTSPTCAARSSPTGPPRTPSRVLVSRGDGLRPAVDDDDVDAWRFERPRRRGRPGGRPDRRASSCSRTRWRCGAGRPSVSTPAQTGRTPRHAGSSELRDVAREQLLAARLDAGESAIVVPEARGAARRGAAARGALADAGAGAVPRRTGRPTPWTRCGAPGRCSPTSSAWTRVRRCAPSSPRCWPSPRPWTHRRARPAAAGRARAGPGAGAAAEPARRLVPAELVDREAELGQLQHAASVSRSTGVPRVAVIEGPAGIGKTSLLHRSATTPEPPA